MLINRYLRPAAGLAALALTTAKAHAIVAIDSSNNLYYLNSIVGATTFYDFGFTGAGAVVANIEGGYVWDQHVLLTQDTVEFSDPSVTGQFDLHATAVGSVINGQYAANPAFNGIAYGATLWSGAIASSWNDAGSNTYSGSFNITNASFSTPYLEALVTGVPQAGGQTADIVSSSWGGSDGPDGNAYLSVAIDGLIGQSGKLFVVAAGNGGPGSDTIDEPASGTNAFVVGGLASISSTPPYSGIASFSSVSPTDFFIPSDPTGTQPGTELLGVRARVDITAPATDMALAFYQGNTGGGQFGYGMPNPPTDNLGYPFDGTSFATPIVSGGAALVVGAGKTLYPNDPGAIDGRVLKAVLMNSADKPQGWNNGQNLVNGVVTTTQSLDYTYGSGILDLNQAFFQYVGGTADLTNPNGTPTMAGGTVQPSGWAFGQITHIAGQTATVNYTISTPQFQGELLATTLVWYSDETVPPLLTRAGLNAAYGSFDNLDLSVYLLGGAQPQLVATSDSLYNSAQELYFDLPADGTYMLEVSENNYVWNFNGDTTTPFGLAWNTALVPEPVGGAMLLGGALLLVRRRRVWKSAPNVR